MKKQTVSRRWARGLYPMFLQNGSLCTANPLDLTYIKLSRTNSDPLHIRCVAAVGTTQNGKIEIAVSQDQLPTNFTSITNQDPVSGVDITNCSFKVIPSSGGISAPPIVAVSFTVSQGVDAPSRLDYKANVDFQTTISLRGY